MNEKIVGFVVQGTLLEGKVLSERTTIFGNKRYRILTEVVEWSPLFSTEKEHIIRVFEVKEKDVIPIL